MIKLIFDIETVGVDFETLDTKSKDFLLAYAEDDEEKEKVKEGLSFSPLTGKIISIGILNPDTDKGAVYFISDKDKQTTEKDIQYNPVAGEKELLKEFWNTALHYDQFITFSGRIFDCPYLMIRSAVNKVKPTRNLMPNRYYDSHIDLADRLTFFGATRNRNNLHLWCQALGIKSPKDSGITGYDVGRLHNEGKYMDIARYCAGDLWATKELFNYWEKYINIK
jgi:predicted PolB exonuclease-like 3'-5' exonuclease